MSGWKGFGGTPVVPLVRFDQLLPGFLRLWTLKGPHEGIRDIHGQVTVDRGIPRELPGQLYPVVELRTAGEERRGVQEECLGETEDAATGIGGALWDNGGISWDNRTDLSLSVYFIGGVGGWLGLHVRQPIRVQGAASGHRCFYCFGTSLKLVWKL